MPPALFIQWKLHFCIKNSLHTLRATTTTHPQHYTIRPSSSLIFFRASTAPPLTFGVYAKSKSLLHHPQHFTTPFLPPPRQCPLPWMTSPFRRLLACRLMTKVQPRVVPTRRTGGVGFEKGYCDNCGSYSFDYIILFEPSSTSFSLYVHRCNYCTPYSADLLLTER